MKKTAELVVVDLKKDVLKGGLFAGITGLLKCRRTTDKLQLS